MVYERQLQNSLYDEVLDTCQCARDACKSVRSYDMLSKQWLIWMKEWRSKFSQIADNQDELADRLRDMEVMEEQLQEYSRNYLPTNALPPPFKHAYSSWQDHYPQDTMLFVSCPVSRLFETCRW